MTESSTPSAVAAGRDRHHATRGRVSERVRQQVAEDLPDPQAVDLDLRDRVGDARLEPDPGLARLSGERSDGGVDQIVRLGRLAMQRERARLGGRERLQVVQEPRHHLGLLQDRSQVRFVDGMDAVDQRLEVRLDHGQRCPELVRDVGEQLPAPGLVRAEPLRHRVERSPEPLHLPRASLLDTGLVVPGGHAVGGLHHVDDRRREPASGADDEEHHEHHDHDPDREERAAVPVVHGRRTRRSVRTGRRSRPRRTRGTTRNFPRKCRRMPRHACGPWGGHSSSSGHHGGFPRPHGGPPHGGPCGCVIVLVLSHRRTDIPRRGPSGRTEASPAPARASCGCSSRARRSRARRTRSPRRGSRPGAARA